MVGWAQTGKRSSEEGRRGEKRGEGGEKRSREEGRREDKWRRREPRSVEERRGEIEVEKKGTEKWRRREARRDKRGRTGSGKTIRDVMRADKTTSKYMAQHETTNSEKDTSIYIPYTLFPLPPQPDVRRKKEVTDGVSRLFIM